MYHSLISNVGVQEDCVPVASRNPVNGWKQRAQIHKVRERRILRVPREIQDRRFPGDGDHDVVHDDHAHQPLYSRRIARIIEIELAKHGIALPVRDVTIRVEFKYQLEDGHADLSSQHEVPGTIAIKTVEDVHQVVVDETHRAGIVVHRVIQQGHHRRIAFANRSDCIFQHLQSSLQKGDPIR